MKKATAFMVFLTFVLGFTSIVFAASTSLVSVDDSGNQLNGWNTLWSISGDGRYIAFSSDDPANNGAFLHDMQTGLNEFISIGHSVSISHDGRYVAFNNHGSAYLMDRVTQEIVPVGGSNPTVSADGQFVAVTSVAGCHVYNTQTAEIEIITTFEFGCYAGLPISSDGRYVAYSEPDRIIYVRDMSNGAVIPVSVDNNGSLANAYCTSPSLSYDGRFVAFESDASNLVSGDTNGRRDIFLHDRDVDENGIYDEPGGISTVRVSVDSNGIQPETGGSYQPHISGDGRYVAFKSDSRDLVFNDGNGFDDIFIHDMQTSTTELISVDSNGVQADIGSDISAISYDGRYVTFRSQASNLVPFPVNGYPQVYLRDRDPNSDNDGDNYIGMVDCNDNDPSINPSAAEVKLDGIDQDCNGYDLTISITKASYKSSKDQLTVEATSGLGQAAGLYIEGYGTMTWDANRSVWSITVQPAGGNPGTITVSGVEGYETEVL